MKRKLKPRRDQARDDFIVKLRDKRGKTFTEIAAYYGYTKQWAHKIYHRATKKAAVP